MTTMGSHLDMNLVGPMSPHYIIMRLFQPICGVIHKRSVSRTVEHGKLIWHMRSIGALQL